MAEPTAGTDGASAAPYAEPSALYLDSSMWVAVAMVVVILIALWKKVPAAIGRSLDGKIASIRAQLAEAEAVRKEAEALRAEYEAKLRTAESDAAAMLTRAQSEAEALIAKAGSDAKALVERRQAMAEAKIGAEERAAVAEIRAVTARAATAAATRLIASDLDAGGDRKLVDEAIAGL